MDKWTRLSRVSKHTSGSTDLDVQGGDAELLAAGGDVLGSQHGGVGGGLVTVGLDLHTTGDTANGLAATGITQNVSRCSNHLKVSKMLFPSHGADVPVPWKSALSRADEPEIGDVDEGVVEGGEDTGNAEDELTCENGGARQFTESLARDAATAGLDGGSTYPRGPEVRERCSPAQGARSFPWEPC